MRKPFLIALLVWACSTAAMAQSFEPAKFEVFGGFAYTPTDLRLQSETANNASTGVNYGWLSSFSYFTSDDLALTGEVGVQYGTQLDSGQLVDGRLRTYLGGATFGNREGPWQINFHVLGGVVQIQIDAPGGLKSDLDTAAAAGGGLDYVGRRFGIRLFQAGVIFSQALSAKPTFRLSSGAFYRW